MTADQDDTVDAWSTSDDQPPYTLADLLPPEGRRRLAEVHRAAQTTPHRSADEQAPHHNSNSDDGSAPRPTAERRTRCPNCGLVSPPTPVERPPVVSHEPAPSRPPTPRCDACTQPRTTAWSTLLPAHTTPDATTPDATNQPAHTDNGTHHTDTTGNTNQPPHKNPHAIELARWLADTPHRHTTR